MIIKPNSLLSHVCKPHRPSFPKRSFFIIILSLFQFAAFSQESNLKETLKKIQAHEKKDTVLYNLYMDAARATQGETYKESMMYTQKAQMIAEELNYTKGIGKAQYFLGNSYRLIAETDSAQLYFSKALTTYKSGKLTKEYADCHNAIGVTHYMVGDFDEALISYKKCIELGKKYNPSDDNTICLSNIGSIYGQKGNYEKAIYYFQEVVRMKQKSGDFETLDGAYNNLGVVYDSQGNWTKALEYYHKAIRIEKKTGDDISLIGSYMNIGRIYFNQKDFEKALDYFNLSKTLALKYNNKHTLNRILTHEAVLYFEQGKYLKSIRTQKEAIQIGRDIGAKQSVSFALNYLGDAYQEIDSLEKAKACYLEAKELKIKIGDNVGLAKSYMGLSQISLSENRLNKALEDALKAKEVSKQFESLTSELHLNKLLSEIYEKMRRYEQAYFYYKTYVEINDSVYDQENVRKIAQLEYEHMYIDSLESATKRELVLSNRVKQADLESAESEQFILWLIIGLLSLLLIALFTISFLVIKNTRTKFKNIAMEQKLLRTQMTPHFLFNSMSIIQGMILNGSYQKSLDYLNDFSKLLRITLENSRNKTVSLEKELEAIVSYVSLQNKTSKRPYNCKIHLDSSTDPKKIALPPMLIQPFIENAIEHGFEEDMENKQINVTIQFDEGDLVCVITDNGVGINKTISQEKATKTSMATQITKDRLKLLSSEFKVRTNFSIMDRAVFSEKGTVVNLILPHKRLTNA